jgi:dolichol-phosphate mannosyltransferase
MKNNGVNAKLTKFRQSRCMSIECMKDAASTMSPALPASSHDARFRPADFTLSVVIPALNEAENLPVLIEALNAKARCAPNLEIVIVDDGSTDGSRDVLRELARTTPCLRYVALSRNFGHQAALRAGLAAATGDCIACMDADLQHPPALLENMVTHWIEGADIVTCIRHDARDISFFKRLTSHWFYRSLNWISGLALEPGSSDFRLLDRKVVDVLNALPESDLFFRGILPSLGFETAAIPYDPDSRRHGTSKYTLRKMVRLALNGVISTSTRPLRLATYFAFLTALAATGFLAYTLYVALVADQAVPGWASTVAVVLIIGMMQLLVLGVIGEYIGQILRETRRRPPFIIEETESHMARKTRYKGEDSE